MFSVDLAFYVAVGFGAQLVDGALGMAYGLIATSVLLAWGAPPSIASASVHAAEVVTTGLAGASHVWHRNVDWRTFGRLGAAGVLGGVIGAYVLPELPAKPVKVFVTLYLLGMALLIVQRILNGTVERRRIRGTLPSEWQVDFWMPSAVGAGVRSSTPL